MSKPPEVLHMVPQLREKKPERKRKNLVYLGVNQGQAYAWTRMGGWASLKALYWAQQSPWKGYEKVAMCPCSKCTKKSPHILMNRCIRDPLGLS